MLTDFFTQLRSNMVTLPPKEEGIEVGSNDKGHPGYGIRMRGAFDDPKTRYRNHVEALLGLAGMWRTSHTRLRNPHPSRGRLTLFRSYKGQIDAGSMRRADGKLGKRNGRYARAGISAQGCLTVVVSGD